MGHAVPANVSDPAIRAAWRGWWRSGSMPVRRRWRHDKHRARQIVELAHAARLLQYTRRQFVEVGGLMSYAVAFSDQYRRAATYVDKILQGTKPANLPGNSRPGSSLSSTCRLPGLSA